MRVHDGARESTTASAAGGARQISVAKWFLTRTAGRLPHSPCLRGAPARLLSTAYVTMLASVAAFMGSSVAYAVANPFTAFLWLVIGVMVSGHATDAALGDHDAHACLLRTCVARLLGFASSANECFVPVCLGRALCRGGGGWLVLWPQACALLYLVAPVITAGRAQRTPDHHSEQVYTDFPSHR